MINLLSQSEWRQVCIVTLSRFQELCGDPEIAKLMMSFLITQGEGCQIKLGGKENIEVCILGLLIRFNFLSCHGHIQKSMSVHLLPPKCGGCLGHDMDICFQLFQSLYVLHEHILRCLSLQGLKISLKGAPVPDATESDKHMLQLYWTLERLHQQLCSLDLRVARSGLPWFNSCLHI